MEDKPLMQRLREHHTSTRREHDVLGVAVFTTQLTVAEEVLVRDRAPADRAAYMVELLLVKCTLADGQPAFTRDDKPDLLAAVAGERLAPLIAAITGRGVEEQAKN